MLGVVLSGGGSKGAYEIGVWKGLRKLGIKYDIVTGTSVGALNAALMCQNTYYRAAYFWKRLSFDDVIDTKMTSTKKTDIYKAYFKGILRGGTTVNNLEKTVDKAINVKKIYKSRINIGIITFNVKTLRPLRLVKRGIPKRHFKDYLIASASCFPVFAKKKIDNEVLIDGGIYDNLPINLAIDIGAKEIIAVDLKEIGNKQKVKNKSIPITYISPKNDIGSFFIFDGKVAQRAIRLGYNDTLKVYNKLDGDKYTFKGLNKFYQKHYVRFYNMVKDDKHLQKHLKNEINDLIKLLEKLGEIFNVDDSYIYRPKKFVRLIRKRLKKVSLKVNPRKNKEEIIKYLYTNINNEKYKKSYPDEYLCACYLWMLENR